MPCSLGWLVGLAGWLALCAWQDLRTQEINPYLTAVPVLLVAGWRAWFPPDLHWAAAPAVGLLLLMVLVADHPAPAVLVAGAAAGLAGIAGPATLLLSITWTVLLVGSLAGLWGPADGKIGMVLVALWPTGELLACLVGALVLGNALALWRRYGWATPFALGNVARAAWQRAPIPAAQLTKLALTPWLAAAAGVYLVGGLGGLW